jgi:DNA-3-methyladenine glycosylase I
MKYCDWIDDELYVDYHNNEWGTPVHDDRTLFEFLVLNGFQCGLSWKMILQKRPRFREVFDNFDVSKIVTYDEEGRTLGGSRDYSQSAEDQSCHP